MNIRKATSEEAPALAELLLMAMEEIMYDFIRERNKQKALEVLEYFIARPKNQYSFENIWLLKENERILAAGCVYDGARLKVLRAPVLHYIKEHHNPSFKPEDETAAGEYYIDSLGVNPDFRGKGLGSRLLQFFISEIAKKRGVKLGLLVDYDNPSAQKLYEKLGFQPVGTKFLMSKKLYHLQYIPQ